MYQVLSNTFREIFAAREKSMKVLFFDTETNQYAPKNMDSISLSNVNNLPYIVQFSYIIYEFTKKGGRTCKVVDHIIKLPEEIGITQDCTNCHGITKQMSTEKGIPVEHVIMNFLYDIESVDFILGHNLEFDLKMAFVEIQRLVNSSKTASQSNYYLEKMSYLQKYENYYCSMKESVEICKLERENSRGKYLKFPSLTELHEFCFQSKPENLHNSLNDVAVGLRCFGFLEYSRDICEEDAVIRELIQKLL
jgi:DNA polymerase III epsilon subunit-like protein